MALGEEKSQDPARGRLGPLSALLATTVVLAAAVADVSLRAQDGNAAIQPPAELKAPRNWPKGHPLPQVASNCVRCHLTAGQRLTDVVQHFAHSAHDLAGLTCYDCHGGNSDDDVSAHEEEHGFIGTKKSAHLANCARCHEDEAKTLAASPHHWDWSKKINTEYPMCVDCHGNHDVGNPPADFKLADVCLDCHESLEDEHPELAAVVTNEDELWASLAEVRRRNVGRDEALPEEFVGPVDELRRESMEIVHGLGTLSGDAARRHNEKSQALKKKLDAWLEKNRR